jgi:hypothetical protein
MLVLAGLLPLMVRDQPSVPIEVIRTLAPAAPTGTALATSPPTDTPTNTATPGPGTPSVRPVGPAQPPTSGPPSTRPTTPRPIQPDAVLLAAGDIASCNSDGDEITGRLLDRLPGTIAALGDIAYPDGSADRFTRCYDPSWGRFKGRTRPTVGNHEYMTAGASAYFHYFGAAAGDPARGYYSYDLGAWHIVVLNSSCEQVGGCAPGSPQEQWLRADLIRSGRACTLAYWHHPLFTSGANHPPALETRPLFQALYDAGAEVVLAGHNHTYERLAPQTPIGALDWVRGIRSFVVGTGGGSHYPFGPAIEPHSEVRNADTYGLLRLVLHDGSYDWSFVPEPGSAFRDSGTGTCH